VSNTAYNMVMSASRGRTVKCAYCGREGVPVTKKGYMKPHVTTTGRRCMHGLIPFPEKIKEGR
jgi:hypothetical protein